VYQCHLFSVIFIVKYCLPTSNLFRTRGNILPRRPTMMARFSHYILPLPLTFTSSLPFFPLSSVSHSVTPQTTHTHYFLQPDLQEVHYDSQPSRLYLRSVWLCSQRLDSVVRVTAAKSADSKNAPLFCFLLT
jgi:hypothetical protein